MDEKTKEIYEYRANILKAISHPTRLFIVDQLKEGERCVCQLTEMIDADTSTVSKHLSILKNAGIIKAEKRAKNVYYKLVFPCVINFLGCVDNVIKKNANNQLKFLK